MKDYRSEIANKIIAVFSMAIIKKQSEKEHKIT